jgi:hypothetical protein
LWFLNSFFRFIYATKGLTEQANSVLYSRRHQCYSAHKTSSRSLRNFQFWSRSKQAEIATTLKRYASHFTGQAEISPSGNQKGAFFKGRTSTYKLTLTGVYAVFGG